MAANLAKAAAVGAMAAGNGNTVPECPNPQLPEYHHPDVCLTKPARPPDGQPDRWINLDKLNESGRGATMIPNTQTVVCPMEVQNLENPSAEKGLDTTWIVENTSENPVVVSWVVDGIEYSPFDVDKSPMEDPRATLKPGEWTSVPTYDSFVYHVREIDDEGAAGKVVLQYRAGLVPIGNPHDYPCEASSPDVEPFDPDTGATAAPFQRSKAPPVRPCNTIDVGFRNQVGCPLHVYWANRLEDVPESGFSCGEKFKFHLGTKPAPQDFFEDWNSATKFEGSYVGHTFVARLASDPSVVIDTYTLQPTRIIDCPNLKQQVSVASKDEKEAEAVVQAQGTVEQIGEPEIPDATAAAAGGAAFAAGAGAGGGGVSG